MEIRILQTKKILGPVEITVKFCQTPLLFKLFHTAEKEGMLPYSFYESTNILILKPCQ
jgi:hypothetical protein